MSTSCKVRKVQINCCFSGAGASTMQRNAAVLTIVCLMTCLTFNYTFPLHRKVSLDSSKVYYPNQTQEYDIAIHHNDNTERVKKKISNFGDKLKRMKQSTQDFGSSVFGKVRNSLKDNILTGEDLRQYEQLVIMKKYPYLDLKELDLKYSPSKIIRESLKSDHDNNNAGPDPSFREPLEEGPNVEIINRGLTGFAIPPELTRRDGVGESKLKYNFLNTNNDPKELSKLSKTSSGKNMLTSLKTEVKQYVEKKNKLPIDY